MNNEGVNLDMGVIQTSITVKIGSINPSHNRAVVGESEQGNDALEASKVRGVHLFRFRKIPRGLDQRGQRSQRLSSLEEGVLWMVSRKHLTMSRRTYGSYLKQLASRWSLLNVHAQCFAQVVLE